MASTIRDPELLAESRRRINREFLSLGIIDGCSLHLGRVVTIAKLSKAEASHVLQRRDLTHEGQVAFRVQGHQRSTKQVELHRELCRKVTIDRAEHFVSGEDVFRIVLEVEDRNEVSICNFFDLRVGPIALSI